MNPEQKKLAAMVVLFIVAIGVVVYQLMFAGGPAVTPAAKSGAAAAPKPGTPAAAAAAVAAAASGPTRLTEANVNIDELLAGVEDVKFDYETMRIDRDPLTALVGGPLKLELPANGTVPIGGIGSIMQKKITGIVFDEYSPMAVVDDEVVGVGHVYPNGIKVYAIERNRVTFQLGDSLIPVDMKEQ